MEIYNGKLKTLQQWFLKEKRITGRQYFQAKQKLMAEHLDESDLAKMVRDVFVVVDAK